MRTLQYAIVALAFTALVGCGQQAEKVETIVIVDEPAPSWWARMFSREEAEVIEEEVVIVDEPSWWDRLFRSEAAAEEVDDAVEEAAEEVAEETTSWWDRMFNRGGDKDDVPVAVDEPSFIERFFAQNKEDAIDAAEEVDEAKESWRERREAAAAEREAAIEAATTDDEPGWFVTTISRIRGNE